MKFINLRKFFHVTSMLSILVLMWGCGSGGGTTPNVVVSKGAAVSVIASSSGEYIIQGENMDGVCGIDMIISYDSSTLSSPRVTQGGFISGALMIANTNIPGNIKVGIVSANGISGSGQIASISFSEVIGTGSVSISSVKMIDSSGRPVQ